MIKELRLKNWKSFEDATLYVDPLTILIGANASGKSNVLDALTFLSRISRGIGFFQAINGDSNLPPLRGGSDWVCLKPHKEFSLEVVTDGESENEEYLYQLTVTVDEVSAEMQSESLHRRLVSSEGGKFAITIAPVLFSATLDDAVAVVKRPEPGQSGLPSYTGFYSDRGILPQLNGIALSDQKLSIALRHVLNQLQGILVFDPVPSHMRIYVPLSKTLMEDGSNIAGVLAGLEESKKQEVEQALTYHLKGLPEKDINKVWAEKIGRHGSDAMLYCEEGWSPSAIHEIDARSMSDGTLRYLAIVAALLTRERGSLLVIEEVDNGLHPSRADLLLDMLRTLGKERNIDIIVTTHNPALLDAAGINMLPYVAVAYRDEATGVSKLKQLEDIKAIPKLLASGNLGKLSAEGRIIEAIQRGDK